MNFGDDDYWENKYNELLPRHHAAMRVVSAAKNLDGLHSTNCETTLMFDRAKYCDCGLEELLNALKVLEQESGN